MTLECHCEYVKMCYRISLLLQKAVVNKLGKSTWPALQRSIIPSHTSLNHVCALSVCPQQSSRKLNCDTSDLQIYRLSVVLPQGPEASLRTKGLYCGFCGFCLSLKVKHKINPLQRRKQKEEWKGFPRLSCYQNDFLAFSKIPNSFHQRANAVSVPIHLFIYLHRYLCK